MPRMALIVLLATLAAVTAAARGAPAGAPPDDPWSSPEIVAPRLEARPLPRPPTPAYHPGRSADAAQPGTSTTTPARPAASSLRTTLALGGVLGLITLLAWGYRVAAGRGTGWRWNSRGRHPGLIEVVSRATLSPRQSLCLVRVGPRLVLLGVTPDAVRALDVIADGSLSAALLGQATSQRSDSHSADFARCLAALEDARTAAVLESGSGPTGELAEDALPDEVRLARTRHALTGALAKVRGVARRCEALGPHRNVVGAPK